MNTPLDIHKTPSLPYKMGKTTFFVYQGGHVADSSGRILPRSYRFNDNPRVRLRWWPEADSAKAARVTMRTIDSLVAEVWLSKPAGAVRIKHIDGDPENCHVHNLTWEVAALGAHNKKAKAVGKNTLSQEPEEEWSIEEAYDKGEICYEYAVLLHNKQSAQLGNTSPPAFSGSKRPDDPGTKHLPIELRGSIPRAEWEAQQREQAEDGQRQRDELLARYTWSTEDNWTMSGTFLPAPFPEVPDETAEERAVGSDLIEEETNLYPSQARFIEGAYTLLSNKPERTELEEKVLGNLRLVLKL